MTDRTVARADLDRLLADVEGARGPDRLLDARVGSLLLPHGARHCLPNEMCPGQVLQHFPRGRMNVWTTPSYTASLDAALALVERVLPGWRRCLEEVEPGARWWAGVKPPDDTTSGYRGDRFAYAPTPALALCAALLRALQTQEPDHDR